MYPSGGWVTAADGQQTKHPATVTATYLFARGKLFFTYVYGGGNDLDWTRQAAKEWASAILAANPSDAATLAKEAGRSGGFDWDQVFRSGVIGLIGYLAKRAKRKVDPTAGGS